MRSQEDEDRLPVLRVRRQVEEAMANGGAMVLSAATGSGKTTQVPQILLQGGTVQGQIVVLEPRRLAARMTAQRVAQELGDELGGVVGFQTRFERALSARTRIRFVTDGVFLRQAQQDPDLSGIGAVLLDEFHERSLYADMALGLVKRARERRAGGTGGSAGDGAGGGAGTSGPLAVGVMSATMDTEAVVRYLDGRLVHAEGRTYPVEVRYEPGDTHAPVWERAARALRMAMEAQPEGDALVFMPGGYEIARTIEAARAQVRGLPGRITVVGLHGSMSAREQDAAVAPAARGERKVVVATNVAETSITIPGIRIVVDAGLHRQFRADPLRGLNTLRVLPISRASADQRAGRAGRTAPGVCIRLWSAQEHGARAAAEAPEIRRVDLAEAMLMVGGPAAFRTFPWLDAPESAAVQRAQQTLELLGALESDGGGAAIPIATGEPTPQRDGCSALGRALARIPAHPRLARVLVAACQLEQHQPGTLRRAALWCAIAAERDVIRTGTPAQVVRLTADGEPPSDLGVRQTLVERVEAGGFHVARHEGVEANLGACREVIASARQLERAVAHVRVDASAPNSARTMAGTFQGASMAMLAGFPDHVAWRMDAQRPHCAMAGRRKVSMDRDSIQRGAGFVLALEIREGGHGDQTHQLLGLVSPLETAWVEAALPGRFTTRVETRFSQELGAAAEFEERLFDGTVIAQVVRPLRGAAAKDAAHEELAARLASGQLRPTSWTEQVDQWIARVRCVAEWFPERKLLRYDDEDMAVLAAEIAHGCARVADLDQRPIAQIMRDALDWEDAAWVDRVAPEALVLRRGFRMKLHYEPGKPPVGRAKIQDFYDFPGHPCVAEGRVKIRLELLGPNFRPVQITDDLPGFWERLYPQVKKELKRRYPRHEWR